MTEVIREFSTNTIGPRKTDLVQTLHSGSDIDNASHPKAVPDNVGSLDFGVFAEGIVARRQSEEVHSIPSRADIFIPPDFSSFPLDFEEPPPYFLNAQEWEIYSSRKAKIEARMEDSLKGTF